ncbi:MAG: alcohol dehydrogenase catalytic domain-containing protein [Desulfobacterales bacterium]|jgi:L-iditol 2-dehydrogenase|nr:alcohol dehydrogenase catalytic domain-containing protein [Desulfobacterales bacterium]
MDVPKKMKAAVLMAPNTLEIKEMPTPQPGPADVLIRVNSCALCGSDVSLMAHPWPGQPSYGTFIPGHEYSGVVAALGETVDEFKVGDRVAVEAHFGCGRCLNCRRGDYTSCLNYGNRAKGHRANGFTTNGGYAEYVINHINTVHLVPDKISLDEACLVTNAGCVVYGFESLGGLVAGDAVVVIGAGPLGLMATQVAKALGADQVILLEALADRLKIGPQVGADHLVNVRETDPVGFVRDHTKGWGADVVVDTSGAKEGPDLALHLCRRMGKVLLIGFPHDPALVDFSYMGTNNIHIYSVRGESRANCARALSLMRHGKINARPLITHDFPLTKISEGFRIFSERQGGAIKVLIKP